jgi:xylan 1,4-beta-xylosidase
VARRFDIVRCGPSLDAASALDAGQEAALPPLGTVEFNGASFLVPIPGKGQEMETKFSCDMSGKSQDFPHFWEHTIGSGHAPLALRADWQQQMRRCRTELGFGHVRFHGILSDDMGTLMCESDKLLYSFFNADQIFDFLLSIGMKPFVELSFMPTTLASGDQIVFHYRANVTPPKDYAQWSVFMVKLVGHWVERYGLAEVRQWPFEVWNEPNLTAFGNGKQSDYFEFYRHTVMAIKSVDASLRVGGPATATNAWIADFLGFCDKNQLPVDFVSTHHYPTDAFGKPGDDTETQLSDSRRSVLRDQARDARRESGDRPLYYTEWSSSSNPRDPLHDEPYAASFVTKTIMEASGLVQGYSYWTFSDIFEENYFPSMPFHGGFGLLNIHGIAKPAYRAFELLHALGTEILSVDGAHPTIDAWVVRGDRIITILLTNFALPRHPMQTETVQVTLRNVRAPAHATVQRIDDGHADAKRKWQALGSPEYLSAVVLAQLHEASMLETEPQGFSCLGESVEVTAVLAPMSVTAITLAYDGSSIG